MIKVLVCDDHLIVRQGIKQILDDAADIELAAEAVSGPEAVRLVRDAKAGAPSAAASTWC